MKIAEHIGSIGTLILQDSCSGVAMLQLQLPHLSYSLLVNKYDVYHGHPKARFDLTINECFLLLISSAKNRCQA